MQLIFGSWTKRSPFTPLKVCIEMTHGFCPWQTLRIAICSPLAHTTARCLYMDSDARKKTSEFWEDSQGYQAASTLWSSRMLAPHKISMLVVSPTPPSEAILCWPSPTQKKKDLEGGTHNQKPSLASPSLGVNQTCDKIQEKLLLKFKIGDRLSTTL